MSDSPHINHQGLEPAARTSVVDSTPSSSDLPHDSYTPTQSGALLAEAEKAFSPTASRVVSGHYIPRHVSGFADPSGYQHPSSSSSSQLKSRSGKRKAFIVVGVILGILAILAAVLVPVGLKIIKPHIQGTQDKNPESPSGARTGGNGSEVIAADGTRFTYVNNFGGFWVQDPNDPFNNGAQPNSWTPPLNTSWTWGVDKVYGVNLGGWFVLEPFIVPSLFQKYQNTGFPVIDEWSLSLAMANDTANGGLNQLEQHYDTFITEQDFAEIAGAGLNWVRIPIPYWAIETWPGEPFLAKVCWKYILRAFQWARKYGLRVNLDLHTIPGSQNGYNHSGKEGQINFLLGVMGIANAQRALEYIRVITEFITQEEYQALIPMFGVVNEAFVGSIGKDEITRFYLQTYDMMRDITGLGEGHGAYMSIHDGFLGTQNWTGFLPGSDRIILDTHPYFAFDGQPNNDSILTTTWPLKACNAWGPSLNESQSDFGVTVAGEWSNGFNDCGLYLTGVNGTTSYGGDCSFWKNAGNWNESVVAGLKQYSAASMDALQNWFFWTWKIGPSLDSGIVESPLWSYQAGLQGGWIPSDPRTALGTCEAVNGTQKPWNGTYQSWQTGGVGAGTIVPSISSEFAQYPPPTLNGINGSNPALLPTYTSTGTVPTLPPATLTAANGKQINAGDGWADASDTAGGVVTVAGCTYPDAWNSVGVAVPTAACTGTAAAARVRGRAWSGNGEVWPAIVTPPPEVLAARR